MEQQLRALDDLPWDLGLFPSTNREAYNHLSVQSQKNLTLLLAFSGMNWVTNIHANKITKSIKIETHKITKSLKIERKYSGVRSFLASIPLILLSSNI